MKQPYRNLEEALLILLEESEKGPVPFKTVNELLFGKTRVLLLIFLSLGFGQIPGSMMVLGPFITYLGFRIAIGRHFVWIPKWMERKKIPAKLLLKNTKLLLKFLKFVKRWSYPRLLWTTQRYSALNGIMISVVGISLSIAPPIPFVSWVAFLAILLIGIGLLNDDGYYIIAGYGAAIFYFILTCILLKCCSTTKMISWITG